MEYITEHAVPLICLDKDFRHPLAEQFEEIDEDGDLVRSYNEWGLASVLAYMFYRRVETKRQYANIEMVIGECLRISRHTATENKALFRAIKREIKAGDREKVIAWSKILVSQLALALAEQHEGLEDYEED
tara:strand:+ start:124 stop:516 length:393 start_codon:yes stop_codon:yes gene_type:complete